MKLHTTAANPPKLRSIKPLKHSLRQLSRSKLFNRLRSTPSTIGSTSDSDGQAIPGPFEAVKSSAESSRSFRIALNLLLVRPWVLVLAFWLVSMAGGTLALNGMLSPRKLTMALPEPAAAPPTVESGQIKVTQLAGDLAGETAASETSGTSETGEVVVETANTSTFPLLPVTMLVGTCAVGCLVVSRRRAMARMAAARARGRGRQARSRVSASRVSTSTRTAPAASGMVKPAVQPARKTVRKVAKGAAPAKGVVTAKVGSSKGTGVATAPRSKKRRQRARKEMMTTKPSTASRVVASRATAQAAMPKARVSKRQVRRATMRAASRRQPIVSVVPASESHSLDWTNGSLAHQMDVRHRSAM